MPTPWGPSEDQMDNTYERKRKKRRAPELKKDQNASFTRRGLCLSCMAVSSAQHGVQHTVGAQKLVAEYCELTVICTCVSSTVLRVFCACAL